jgi:hypothetical protein
MADAGRDVPDGAAVLPEVPAELNAHPLLLAVLHAVVFLHGSDAQVVHEAAADEALGHVAGYLQRLSGQELKRVREDLDALAAFAREEQWPRDNVEFFRHFLADFGVTGDQTDE